MNTKGFGKLSQRLAKCSLESPGCLLRGSHSYVGLCVRIQLLVSAGALVLFQLAHKLTSLLQRLDLGPAFSILADRIPEADERSGGPSGPPL